MAHHISRRAVLFSGLGAAGCLWGSAAIAEALVAAALPDKRPDRSAQAPSLPVAIQRCETYEPKALRRSLDAALDLIGGINTLVQDKTVTIKINVTGGPGTLAGLPGYRTYQIHPNLLAALCAVFSDAGARRIVVVESQYSAKTPEAVLAAGGWDVKGIQSAGGQRVTFEDTRNRGRWPSYSRLKVPWGGFLYPSLDVNQTYEKTDVFISLAKLKEHIAAGMTASVKNLFGMIPTSLYGNNGPREDSLANRSSIMHEGSKPVPDGIPGEIEPRLPRGSKNRVPRVTADCLGARPVDLAVVDGIETNNGGEGPWTRSTAAIKPNLLLVGRNAVCTDAICAAVMGFDPQAGHGQFPFPGENHLRLLASVGVGAIDPKRIEVRGLPLDKAIFPFNESRTPRGMPTAMYGPQPRESNA